MSHTMIHKSYEDSWFSAFPLGNGRLGAMVYGSPEKDTIVINEESLWSGKKYELKTIASPEVLAEIRSLIFDNRLEEAGVLCKNHLCTTPRGILSYQSFCNVTVDFFDRTPYTDYSKALELKKAMTSVSWKRAGKVFTAQSFISAEYDAWFYKVSSESAFSCAVDMTRGENAYTSSLKNDTLILRGRITWNDSKIASGIESGEGMSFGGNLRVITDGIVTSTNGKIYVSNATEVLLVGVFMTNYEQTCICESYEIPSSLESALSRAVDAGWDNVLKKHLEDWGREYDKSSLVIDVALPTSYDTTDMRLEVMKYHGHSDPSMFALYYNYGRYLLLSSSAFRAKLPANLQGIWCDGFTPPWGSDYHNNINVQMNYWHADNANVTAALTAFVNYVKTQAKNGRETATKLYGTDGWTTHLVSDVFGFTGTGGSSAGVFSMAGPWLCLNLWEHFEYTRDFKYLNDIYPILKGACLFLKDFLSEDKNGKLVTCPTNSPENAFYYTDNNGVRKTSTLTYGTAMDTQIVKMVLTRGIWAAKLLWDDDDFIEALESIIPRLLPLRVSERYSTLCEWCEDYEETEPGHRHISHLFGLYPGDLIDQSNPELYEAARRSLMRRIENGSGGTGWSMAWFVNFWARLHDADRADNALRCLVKDFTTHNLMDQHPPFPLFQIDGNFGGTAGIVEMLLQSHMGDIDSRIIELIPALPKSWTKGRIKGIRARGGFTLDIEWSDGRLRHVSIVSDTDNILRILDTAAMKGFFTEKEYTVSNGVIEMKMSCGEKAELNFKGEYQ